MPQAEAHRAQVVVTMRRGGRMSKLKATGTATGQGCLQREPAGSRRRRVDGRVLTARGVQRRDIEVAVYRDEGLVDQVGERGHRRRRSVQCRGRDRRCPPSLDAARYRCAAGADAGARPVDARITAARAVRAR